MHLNCARQGVWRLTGFAYMVFVGVRVTVVWPTSTPKPTKKAALPMKETYRRVLEKCAKGLFIELACKELLPKRTNRDVHHGCVDMPLNGE